MSSVESDQVSVSWRDPSSVCRDPKGTPWPGSSHAFVLTVAQGGRVRG